MNSSIVHPREVFSYAIKNSSASIIICHNHPSGDPSPSDEDIKVTYRLEKCGEILGIHLIDHLIIGNGQYISLKEKEYCEVERRSINGIFRNFERYGN